MYQEQTCILLFSRNPELESKFKRLHPSKKKNLALLQTLFDYAISQIKKTNLPFYIVDDSQQVGKTFGERLANAVENFLPLYENIIILGNDCPNISSNILLTVHHQMVSGQQVLGKAKDGGTYIIGIKKSKWEKSAFQELPWNSNLLFQSILQYFDETITSILSDIHADLDQPNDLQNFLKTTLQISQWHAILRKFIQYKSSPHQARVSNCRVQFLHRGCWFRGPPICLN